MSSSVSFRSPFEFPVPSPTPEIVRNGLVWAPMVFNIGNALRWRAHPEFNGVETVLLVKRTGRAVLLVRVQLQSIRRQRSGKGEKTGSEPLAPLVRIDVLAVDVRVLHGDVAHNRSVERTYPDVASGANGFPEELRGALRS
jgi:hypothetical protein